MAENYLITGYWGEPHVTAENDRGINAAIFGAGRFVLPVGEQFRAEYIGNNTVRMYDGKLIDNGAVAGIPAGEYIDLLIPEAGQGKKRNDLIIFQYSQDTSTLIESGRFVVVPGEETSGTASDPTLTNGDLLSNKATFDQMALWRVPVSGTVISAPVMLFNTKFASERIVTAHSTDGENYTVELPGVAKLYTGLEMTIIPDKDSATTLPNLNINGLGAVSIKRRISSSNSITVQSESENFLIATQPIRIFYNGKCWIADMARPYAPDLYGVTPIENGGTGADTAAEALINLGAAPATESADYPGCYYRIVDGVNEWYNPPMIEGVEYRTTERHLGKPVYTVSKPCGTLPNSASKTVYIGFPADELVRMECLICLNGQYRPIRNFDDFYFKNGNSAYVLIKTNEDMTNSTGLVQVWYTKP